MQSVDSRIVCNGGIVSDAGRSRNEAGKMINDNLVERRTTALAS
jgi:hypothetical protein